MPEQMRDRQSRQPFNSAGGKKRVVYALPQAHFMAIAQGEPP
jgi:hypothetical protein